MNPATASPYSIIRERILATEKNIKTWAAFYLGMKEGANMDFLKTQADLDRAYNLLVAVLEGAAFLPDLVIQLEKELLDFKLPFANRLSSDGERNVLQQTLIQCARMVSVDRPEPMAGVLRKYREDLEARRDVLRAEAAEAPAATKKAPTKKAAAKKESNENG